MCHRIRKMGNEIELQYLDNHDPFETVGILRISLVYME